MSPTSPSLSARLPEITPSAPLALPARFGRYRLTHLLAVGGMAQIYLAKSFGVEGFVKSLVIKRLDPKLAVNDFFTDLFINEAKLLVTLSHGNVVPVFDFGRVGDDLYMAMEYVHGASLGRLLKLLSTQERSLGLHLCAYIAMEVCKGLDYAHRKTDARGRPAGIIHRDIKPSNILISLEGEVKIVDFGVAKLAGRLEQKQRLAGTVAYMSPEQANQQPVDARTDIFSSALVLHEMLSRRRVYDAESIDDILAQAQRARVPELPAQIPRELRAVVERALATRPEERYSAAHAMEQELSTYLLLHRSVGETLESRSPTSQLAELMRQLPLPADLERLGGVDEAAAGPVTPLTGPSIELPSLSDEDDEPDLALIRGAAETFHSEFFTRVLQHQDDPSRWDSLKKSAVIAGAALVLAGALATLLLWPSDRAPHSLAAPGAQLAPDGGSSSFVVQWVDAGSGTAAPDATILSATVAIDVDAAVAAPADAAIEKQSPRRGSPRFGYLNINSVPWSNVIVDGRRLKRTTPVLKLPLEPGIHVVELVNPVHKLKRVLRIKVRPGATTWKVVKLREGQR